MTHTLRRPLLRLLLVALLMAVAVAVVALPRASAQSPNATVQIQESYYDNGVKVSPPAYLGTQIDGGLIYYPGTLTTPAGTHSARPRFTWYRFNSNYTCWRFTYFRYDGMQVGSYTSPTVSGYITPGSHVLEAVYQRTTCNV